MSPPRHRWLLLGAIMVWAGLVATGLGGLVRYSLIPGRDGKSPVTWPAASRLARAQGRYLLVLAAHPHCPCTRASLSELAVVMTRCRGRLLSRVLFIEPQGFTERWAVSDLWRIAEAIPGVEPVLDPRGLESRRFGAFTSGQTALYDPSGRLVFSGGITGARGHAGSNAGEEAVVALVGQGQPSTAWAPVYGCPLEGPAPQHPTPPSKETRPCPSS